MKKIITLLALIIIMVFAQSAVAHFFIGTWFVSPMLVSIWLVMLIHFVLFACAVIDHIKKGIEIEK